MYHGRSLKIFCLEWSTGSNRLATYGIEVQSLHVRRVTYSTEPEDSQCRQTLNRLAPENRCVTGWVSTVGDRGEIRRPCETETLRVLFCAPLYYSIFHRWMCRVYRCGCIWSPTQPQRPCDVQYACWAEAWLQQETCAVAAVFVVPLYVCSLWQWGQCRCTRVRSIFGFIPPRLEFFSVILGSLILHFSFLSKAVCTYTCIENYALLGCYAAKGDTSVPTLRDRLSVTTSKDQESKKKA